jgi:GNAT superfamily N-acetyltransferase
MFAVAEITVLPEDILALGQRARCEGFRFIDRLIEEFHSGANTFSAPGEVLFEVRDGGRLIAVGGLNRDPYVSGKRLGRLRRVYVDPDCRRQGVGKILLDAIECAAKTHFSELRLFTDSERAASFYASLGYAGVLDVEHFSQVKALSSG